MWSGTGGMVQTWPIHFWPENTEVFFLKCRCLSMDILTHETKGREATFCLLSSFIVFGKNLDSAGCCVHQYFVSHLFCTQTEKGQIMALQGVNMVVLLTGCRGLQQLANWPALTLSDISDSSMYNQLQHGNVGNVHQLWWTWRVNSVCEQISRRDFL